MNKWGDSFGIMGWNALQGNYNDVVNSYDSIILPKVILA